MDSTNNHPDWDLIGRYLAGEATADEQARAKQWLAAHPEDARLLELVDRTAPTMAPPPVSEFETEAALRSIRSRMSPPSAQAPKPPSAWRRHRWLAAAAVIAALGLWTLLRSREHTGPVQLAVNLSTQSGQVDTLVLDDGSRIILAPNTRIAVNGRDATLHGQAYFDVVHSDTKPFTVRTSAALIRDLGTAFDVSEDADGAVVVDVTEGVVELRPSADTTARGVTLQRGDRGRVRPGAPPVAQRAVVRGAPAWTSGQLVFQDARMDEVRSGLRRWYGVELQVHDSVMAQRHLTATFGSEPVDQALHILALAVGGTIERRGNTAILHSTPLSTAR